MVGEKTMKYIRHDKDSTASTSKVLSPRVSATEDWGDRKGVDEQEEGAHL